MNFDNNPIDELFRQAANQSVPELPSGVMDRVLGEWQKMSNPSVNSDGSNNGNAENFQLNSSKISNPSAGEISQVIRIAGKALGFPQLAVAVGFIAVAVAGVVWLSMESNSSDGNQKSTSKMVEERSINVDEENTVEPIEKNLRANGNNDVNEKLETSARPGDLGNSTNVDPGHSVNSINKPAPNNGVSREIGENTGKSGASVSGSTLVVNAQQTAVVAKSQGSATEQSSKRIADLRFELGANGWVSIFPSSHSSDNTYIDWGDGKVEKLNSDKSNLKHRYLPYSKRKFSIQLLEMSSPDAKIKTALAKSDVWITPDLAEEKIPDVVTVNGDGYNDEFYVIIPEPEYFEMLIFDKRNAVVFRSYDPQIRWSARDKELSVMEGEFRVLLTLKYSGEPTHRFIRRRLLVQQ